MSCLSCENYIPLDPPIQRTDSHGQTYKVPGLCKIGADHIIWVSCLSSNGKM